jgi:hypothetical protein
MRRWPGASLDASAPGARTLAVAGNAHTPTSPIELSVPMGARLAGQRRGVREIRISYGGGGFYNGGPRQFARRTDPPDKVRLYQHDGELVQDLPPATEAVVPHRRSHDHHPARITLTAAK